MDVHHQVIGFPDSRMVLKSLRIIFGNILRRHRIISFETPSDPDDLYGLKMYDAESSSLEVILKSSGPFSFKLEGISKFSSAVPNDSKCNFQLDPDIPFLKKFSLRFVSSFLIIFQKYLEFLPEDSSSAKISFLYFRFLHFGGWSYRLTPVRSFVSLEFFSKTDHRICLIFCIKLACYESKEVTEADF